MYTIHLNNLRFHAYHGCFTEEKSIGETFEVNVVISYAPRNMPVQGLSDALNYAEAYEVICEIMNKKEELLETVTYNMAQAILNKFELVKKIELTVTKLNPPIANFNGNISVTYSVER